MLYKNTVMSTYIRILLELDQVFVQHGSYPQQSRHKVWTAGAQVNYNNTKYDHNDD